jgi:diguanylate cyclase (GGDEF)-like protein/PAS domain S-box-containing protein
MKEGFPASRFDAGRFDAGRVDPVGLPARTIGAVVNRTLLTCPTSTSIADAARRMRDARCSSIVVVEGGHAVGIWTERDALKLDLGDPATLDRPIAEVMTAGVQSISEDVPVSEAGLRFKRHRIRHLLVVDHAGKPVGMVTQTDVVQNHGVEDYLTFRDVRSVMSQSLPVLDPALSLGDAASIIRGGNGEAAVVVDGDGRAGIVTERDLVRMIAERRTDLTVGQVASFPVITVTPQATLLAARALFTQHGIRHLAVREFDGGFVGLLSFSDILSILQHEYASHLNEALRERDEALMRSRKDLMLARQVIEASIEGVLIVGADGAIEYVNPAFSRLTGYTADEVVGRNPNILQSGRQDRGFYERMWQELQQRGYWQGELWNRRKNGEEFAERLSINAIHDAAGRIMKYAAIFSDITVDKQKAEEVHSLAFFDTLTNLPNRRMLMDRLSVALAGAHRRGGNAAVMFMDLDLFKQINDTLGHDAGDHVLVETARRLEHCMREGDTVSRIGGDEFVMLLPELAEAADATRLAERAIAAVVAPIDFHGKPLGVTASVGIALYPDDGTDGEALLKSADLAMYQAKRSGRNGFHLCSPTLNARTQRRLSIEHRLERALADGAFTLAYQVKADVTSGEVCGTEALIRWNDPEVGLLPPSEFLPVAEKMGLMPKLGEWVLRTACAQGRQWQERGLASGRMAVNISPYQFRNTRLADAVPEILRASGLAPERLELELSEQAIIDHPKEVAEVLEHLSGSGVVITIDDFGTRYSSLEALQRLPIHALKIDRSYVAGLRSAITEKDMVTAIISLAHALGMEAIAEGVETREQADFLRHAGCDQVQGWLISHALAPDSIEKMLRHPVVLPG